MDHKRTAAWVPAVLMAASVHCKSKSERASDGANRHDPTPAPAANAPVTPAPSTKPVPGTASPPTPSATAAPATGAVAPGPNTHAPPPPGVAAYVVRDDVLQRLTANGSAKPLHPVEGATFCTADGKSGRLWLLDDVGLQSYDPKTGQLETIVQGDIETFELRFGERGDRVGNVDPLEDCVALVVMATPRPSVRAEIVSLGDRDTVCFENMDADDRKQWTLDVEPAELFERYEKLRLADPKALAAVAKRRARAGANGPPPAKVKLDFHMPVDRARCKAEPKECGKVWDRLGTDYWLVITGSDRGDFFHQTVALVDGRSREYVDPHTGARTKTPPTPGMADDELDPIVAPDGKSMLLPDGTWFSFVTGKPIRGPGGRACGFL